MKRILFLLLLTVSVYGQNPSRFAKIQITGNTNSGTATKVNVQEANGEVNTQTINTGFNRNIGLGGSDVVGANTLLNQYSTTPVDWTATVFNSGQVVFYGGKQWIAKMATVAGDVPAVSSKWDEITFESLSNKTAIVDATPTDGSNNAVSSNGVFDALATKEPSFTKNTAFNKNFGTTAGTVAEGNDSRFTDSRNPLPNSANYIQNQNTTPQAANMWISGAGQFGSSVTAQNVSGSVFSAKNTVGGFINLGINSNTSSTAYINYTNSLDFTGGPATFSSTVTASPATTANQVPTWGQVQAIAKPYKVYTAVLTQQNTDAPSAVVLENTLGGTVVWTRNTTGNYYGTLNSAFPIQNKIALFQGGGMSGILPLKIIRVQYLNSNTIQIITQQATDGALVDNSLANTSIEIRVYL